MKKIKYLVVFMFSLCFLFSVYMNLNLYDSKRSNEFFDFTYWFDIVRHLENYDSIRKKRSDISLNDLVVCSLKSKRKHLQADFTNTVDHMLYLDINKQHLLNRIKTKERELSEYLQTQQEVNCFDLSKKIMKIRESMHTST